MADATPNIFGFGLSPAARQALWKKADAERAKIFKEKGAPAPKPLTAQDIAAEVNNSVWNNSVDALSAGAGNPQVRAGVLRLLSTVPGVTVADSATAGQPTLTLTAGPAVFGGSGEEILTVSATTGMPVKAVMPGYQNVPTSVQTFQVSRVTLAAVAAGKF